MPELLCCAGADELQTAVRRVLECGVRAPVFYGNLCEQTGNTVFHEYLQEACFVITEMKSRNHALQFPLRCQAPGAPDWCTPLRLPGCHQKTRSGPDADRMPDVEQVGRAFMYIYIYIYITCVYIYNKHKYIYIYIYCIYMCSNMCVYIYIYMYT